MGYRKLDNSALKPDPYYSEVYATFGDRLFAARDAAGLTQRVLANKMGVKLKTIQDWEADRVEPRANELQMVSAVLNVSMVWIMSGLGNGITPPVYSELLAENELNDVLNELRSIRAIGEKLLNRVVLLDKKLSKKKF